MRRIGELTKARGHAMLLLLVLLALGALAAGQSQVIQHARSFQQNNQALQEHQSLQTAREALLAFAARQGMNQHTQPGHLPCPALSPEGPAQTTCLNSNWGWLPGQSVVKINYLNPGLGAPYNAKQLGVGKSWQYAVSTQLLQPNALGWSQWVDFSKPALTVQTEQGVFTQVAAVLAQQIQPIGPNTFGVQGPHQIIPVQMLQATLRNNLQQAAELAVLTHAAQHGPGWHPSHAPETLQQQTPQLWRAVDPQCECRCTPTRCTCQCPQTKATWSSKAPCLQGQTHCLTDARGPSICHAQAGQSCIFLGPAHLHSLWPVSRYLPAAGAGRACQPTNTYACPLSSKTGQACECKHGWPSNIYPMLNQVLLVDDGKPNWRVLLNPEAAHATTP